MTWAELINTIPADQLNTDVTVLIGDEFFGVKDNVFFSEPSDDALDPGHPYISV